MGQRLELIQSFMVHQGLLDVDLSNMSNEELKQTLEGSTSGSVKRKQNDQSLTSTRGNARSSRHQVKRF